MSSRISGINIPQPNAQIYNERFCYYNDDNKIKKVSLPIQQNDSFEKINNSRIDEMGMVTITSSVLGGGIGYWIARSQKFFTKLVVTSLGALLGIGVSAYYYAKKIVNENMKD